jgi:excisionase family DNA binding protein
MATVMNTVNAAELMTPQEVAELLRVNVGTLSVWRCVGRTNLKFLKVGAAVRYRRSDVLAFLESRSGTSTAQIAANN